MIELILWPVEEDELANKVLCRENEVLRTLEQYLDMGPHYAYADSGGTGERPFREEIDLREELRQFERELREKGSAAISFDYRTTHGWMSMIQSIDYIEGRVSPIRADTHDDVADVYNGQFHVVVDASGPTLRVAVYGRGSLLDESFYPF